MLPNSSQVKHIHTFESRWPFQTYQAVVYVQKSAVDRFQPKIIIIYRRKKNDPSTMGTTSNISGIRQLDIVRSDMIIPSSK